MGSLKPDSMVDLRFLAKRARLVNAMGETREIEAQPPSGDGPTRLLSVPLKEGSPAYIITMLSGDRTERVDKSSQESAEDRADDGNPAIAPVTRPFVPDGHQRVDEARPEVAGGVDGVTGRSPQR